NPVNSTVAGREKATGSQQKSENSWLEREKAAGLARRLAGRACPVLRAV
ncbi:hypothetical protein A2U01_0118940, partial [Trifolium medium]|nr:hypothetical protein [Trifolium medium]